MREVEQMTNWTRTDLPLRLPWLVQNKTGMLFGKRLRSVVNDPREAVGAVLVVGEYWSR